MAPRGRLNCQPRISSDDFANAQRRGSGARRSQSVIRGGLLAAEPDAVGN